jgi:apolipoprotein N-acyltransferase
MDTLPGFARRFPNLAAPVLGALSATGFQPVHIWPLGLAAMAAFGWLAWERSSWKAALLGGWLFGVAHFTVTNNWIATAFTYQAEMPAALGWAAVPLLALYLAVWPALATLAAWTLSRNRSLAVFALALGACWIAAEWFRSWVFTGYSWGPFSMMLVGPWDRPGLARLLPFFGSYALSGAVVALAVGAAWLVQSRRWITLAVAGLAVTAAFYLPAAAPREGTLALTLVQPDLKQTEIDDPSKFEEQFRTIAGLSVPRIPGQTRLVLWPESGVPDYLRDGYPQRYYSQMTVAGDPAFARARIGSVSRLGPRYAKAHLVPYGEYLPLRPLLEPLGLTRLVAGSIDFIPGPGAQTQDLGAFGQAGMQLCYEIVFSGEVVDRDDRPDYIFNPSNDGWFGLWGPPQHLAQARMRAAEEGLPVLRATTTGISAVIDARGVVREHIGRNQADRIDTVVPPSQPATPFALLGHWLTLAWSLLFLFGSLVASRRERR